VSRDLLKGMPPPDPLLRGTSRLRDNRYGPLCGRDQPVRAQLNSTAQGDSLADDRRPRLHSCENCRVTSPSPVAERFRPRRCGCGASFEFTDAIARIASRRCRSGTLRPADMIRRSGAMRPSMRQPPAMRPRSVASSSRHSRPGVTSALPANALVAVRDDARRLRRTRA
jgi:hypothetical protein